LYAADYSRRSAGSSGEVTEVKEIGRGRGIEKWKGRGRE